VSATAIEWASHVWNPFTGCDRVSPGCAHCYALSYASRLKGMGQAKYQNDGDPKTSGPGFGFTVHDDQLQEPPRFPAGARVFVNSMSDVFHEEASDVDIARVFGAAAAQPHADFLILTKRAERMRELAEEPNFIATTMRASGEVGHDWPLPNVWLAVSIENRRFVHRADLLRETPAAVRFISAEPLLGPLMPPWESGHWTPDERGRHDLYEGPGLDLTDIDWLIVGGESGHQARRMDLQWVRDLRDATRCSACGGSRARQGDYGTEGDGWCDSCEGVGSHTAFFFKQVGGRTPKAGGRELDGRTWDELPRGRDQNAAGERGIKDSDGWRCTAQRYLAWRGSETAHRCTVVGSEMVVRDGRTFCPSHARRLDAGEREPFVHGPTEKPGAEAAVA
jgi:protein gp37